MGRDLLLKDSSPKVVLRRPEIHHNLLWEVEVLDVGSGCAMHFDAIDKPCHVEGGALIRIGVVPPRGVERSLIVTYVPDLARCDRIELHIIRIAAQNFDVDLIPQSLWIIIIVGDERC
jgi:hypothetical protein